MFDHKKICSLQQIVDDTAKETIPNEGPNFLLLMETFQSTMMTKLDSLILKHMKDEKEYSKEVCG